MENLFNTLNEEEIDQLDRFLLDRIDEEADTEGKDEGVLNISELDGFFTALVSGPVSVPSSRWLPTVWGDFEPTWKDQKNFDNIRNAIHQMCGKSTPGGWRAVTIMRLLQRPHSVLNRASDATILALAAVARNTRSVVCIDVCMPTSLC